MIEGIKPPPQQVLGLAGLPPQLPVNISTLNLINQISLIQHNLSTENTSANPSDWTQPDNNHWTDAGANDNTKLAEHAEADDRSYDYIQAAAKHSIAHNAAAGHTGPNALAANVRAGGKHRDEFCSWVNLVYSSALLPPSQNIVQIRGPHNAQLQRTGAVQIRATSRPPNSTPTNKVTAVKVGQTQIKAITPSLHPPSLAAISSNSGPPPTPTLSVLSTINSASTTSLPVPSLPTVLLPPEALRAREQMQNSLHHNNNNHFEPKLVEIKAPQLPHMERINASLTPISAKTLPRNALPVANKSVSKKKRDTVDRDSKDEKANSGSGMAGSTAAAAANSFFQQSSMSSSIYGDDDINDVAAMGGVNLAEESQRILGCTENIGTQIRSCKDEVFLNLPALQARIRAITAERGLEEPSQDVAVLISHACQERLKNIVEKLAVIADHRIDVIKVG